METPICPECNEVMVKVWALTTTHGERAVWTCGCSDMEGLEKVDRFNLFCQRKPDPND